MNKVDITYTSASLRVKAANEELRRGRFLPKPLSELELLRRGHRGVIKNCGMCEEPFDTGVDVTITRPDQGDRHWAYCASCVINLVAPLQKYATVQHPGDVADLAAEVKPTTP